MMHEEIKTKTLSGVAWKFLERFIAQGTSLVITILIARILLPSDYVPVSITAIFFTFADTLISGGLNTALIQKKDATERDYATVLVTSVTVAFIVAAILFLMAPVISRLYSNGSLTAVFRVLCLSLPVYAVKSVVCAYISSTLQFRLFFFATLGGTVISGVVGIWLALNGAGVWALVAQQITNTVIDTVLLIICARYKLAFAFSKDSFSSLFRYGWKILVSSLIGVIYNETTPLIIGLKYSGADLAFYEKGRSFPIYLSSATTSTLAAVLFPVFSKFQDDKKQLLHYTRRYIQIASFLAFPAMLGFFAISDSFIVVFLTEKWCDAAYFIRLFCVVNMFDVIAVGNCETIKAMGRSDVFLKIEIIKKTAYFITIALFLIFSKNAQQMAWASVVCMIIQIIVNSIPNIKLLSYSIKDQLFDLLPNLLSAAVMLFAVLQVGKLPLPPAILLVLQIISGFAIYALIAVITKNSSWSYCLAYIRHFVYSRREQNR